MDDLEQLRRRLSLAVLASALGCTSDGAATEAAPQAVAVAAPKSGEPGESATGDPRETSKTGGMASVVQAARDKAAAAELARIEAAKPKVDAAAVCEVALDKVKAMAEASLAAGDELGCPRRTSTTGTTGKYSGYVLAVPQTQTLRDGGDEDNCCYRRMRPPVRGRPYRVDGSLRLPSFGIGARRSQPRVVSSQMRAAAAGWLHDAREELASVAAFQRAAIELAAVSAPRQLIATCHVAAEQERRHAALCLTIAEGLADRTLCLGPAPKVEARHPDLLQLLLHTFEEGCVGETIAAVVARRSARGASASIGATLLEIADDEAEHAALAWRTLAWGLPRLSASERSTLFDLAARCIEVPLAREDRAEESATAATHGRLPTQTQAQISTDVCRRVIRPLLQQLRRGLHPAPSLWTERAQST